MKGPVINAPNIVSLSRIPLGLAACYLVAGRIFIPALACIFLAILSDFVDGLIARRTDSVSEWGKIFDPLADKIAIGSFIITLALIHAVPLWFVLLFLARDLLIAAGGLYMTRRLGGPPSSNIWGKYSSLTISVYLTIAAAGFMLDRRLWPDSFLIAGLDPVGILALGFVLISLFVYFFESVNKLRNLRSGSTDS